jgi:hypothetical protein
METEVIVTLRKLTCVQIMYKNSFHSLHTISFSLLQNQSVCAVLGYNLACFENYAKQTNILCGQNSEFV